MTKYVHLVNIPLAVAALMVIYHIPDLSPSTHLKLNGQVLAQIFAGTITPWERTAIRSLNPGVALPSSAIVPVHRSDASGTEFLFTSYLNAQDPADWSPSLIGTTVAWPAQPAGRGADGSDNMISTVGSSPGAIGYVGVSYLAPVSQAGEGEAALANSAGRYVLPTASTMPRPGLASFTNTPDNGIISLINGSAAQAYPVINYEYAIVSTAQPSAALAQDLRAFLSWALTSGTAQLGPVNFQPLPASVVTQAQAQIAKITG